MCSPSSTHLDLRHELRLQEALQSSATPPPLIYDERTHPETHHLPGRRGEEPGPVPSSAYPSTRVADCSPQGAPWWVSSAWFLLEEDATSRPTAQMYEHCGSRSLRALPPNRLQWHISQRRRRRTYPPLHHRQRPHAGDPEPRTTR